MDNDIFQQKEWHKDAKRRLDHAIENFKEMGKHLSNCMQALEATDDAFAEIDKLSRALDEKQMEIENLQAQLNEEKEQRTKAEMQLKEMTQLSTGVAKKASQEEVLKVIRTFVNKSKRKRIEKRIAVKEMVLEMTNASGIVLPEDLAATIDALDDEQPDAKEDIQMRLAKAIEKVANKPTTQNIYGDKNDFQGGAELIKMELPQGEDPANVAQRLIEGKENYG